MFWLLGYGGMNDREAGSDSMFNLHHTYIQANLPNTHATPTYYKSISTANINLILDILIRMIIQKKYFSFIFPVMSSISSVTSLFSNTFQLTLHLYFQGLYILNY